MCFDFVFRQSLQVQLGLSIIMFLATQILFLSRGTQHTRNEYETTNFSSNFFSGRNEFGAWPLHNFKVPSEVVASHKITSIYQVHTAKLGF
jgi:hypothetical protein